MMSMPRSVKQAAVIGLLLSPFITQKSSASASEPPGTAPAPFPVVLMRRLTIFA